MTRKFCLVVASLVVGAVAQVHQTRAATAALGASQDNTIYSPGDLSNGAGPVMFAGRPPAGNIQRALIQFDVASGIPSGATVTSVSLKLYMSQTHDVDDANLRLNRVLSEWGEGASSAGGGGPTQGGGQGAPAEPGDATWTHRIYPTTEWVTDGGDFDPNVSSSLSVGLDANFYTWPSTPRLVSDVQNWLDDPGSNFGWILRGNEQFAGTSRRFDTSEYSDPNNHPALLIEYTLAGPTADFTGDTYVDGEDLAIWEAAYAATNTGDTDDDGDTDGVDFLNWQLQYTGPPPGLAAVPEPASVYFVLLAALAALGGRYRLWIGT